MLNSIKGMRTYSSTIPRLFRKDGYPIALVYLVTGRCQLRCSHCYVDKVEDDEGELTLPEIRRLGRTMRPLLWLAAGGGEPFMREDLPEILISLCREPGARHLTITTNGLEPERIAASAKAIARSLENTVISISVSLDGPPFVHDGMRGRKGVYSSALKTIKLLAGLRRRYGNLSSSITTVIHRGNLAHLPSFLEWAKDSLPVNNIILNLIRGETPDPELLHVGVDEYERIVSLKKRMIRRGEMGRFPFPLSIIPVRRELILYELVDKTLRERRRVAPCYAATLSGVLKWNGDILACEPYPLKMGNIRDKGCDFGALWFSEGAGKIRNHLKEKRCFCTYECALTLNILFNPLLLSKTLLSILRPGF